MFNQITVIGNVGSDPQVNKTSTGKDVANFSVAVNEKFGTTETTTWFKVEAWNGLAAKVVAPFVKKGGQVMVQGRAKIETWTDANGKTQANIVIVAESIKLLGNKPA